MRAPLVVAVLCSGALGATATARAQVVTGFADDRFEPAGAGSQWLTAESLDFAGHLRPAAALVADWAVHPIVVYTPEGNSAGALVGEQMLTHFDAAVMMWNRVRFDLNLPLSLFASGTTAQIDTQSYAAPQSGVVGDIRLGAAVRVLQRSRGHLVAAAGLQLFVPTGTTRAFTGDGGVRLWPRAMVSGERRRVVWAASLGLQYRPKDDCGCSLAPGTELNGGAAAGWRFSPRIMAGPELFAALPLSGGTLAARGTPAIELLVGGHFAVHPGWDVSVGLSRGLTQGPGAPAFRAVAGVQFVLPLPASPTPPPPDGAMTMGPSSAPPN